MAQPVIRSCCVAQLVVLALLAASAPAKAQRPPAPAEINLVRPEDPTLQPGQTVEFDLYGRRLLQAQGVLIERNRAATSDVTGRLQCQTNQLCLLTLAVRNRAREARYRVFLTDADRQPLVEVPFRLVVDVPPRGEQPDRIVTLQGEPGVSIQRNCEAGADDETVALLEPAPGGGLVVNTELVWQRTEHEQCVAGVSGKKYRIAFCAVPNVNCNTTSAQYVILALPQGDWLGNGRVSVTQADVDGIANETGIGAGGTVYWQMRYEYISGGDQAGPWTATRPLTFNVPDPEPEPEPDPPGCPTCPAPPTLLLPNAESVLSATNRSFSWSQTAGAQSWDLCFMLPPATGCAQTLRRTQPSLSGLGFEDFAALGLIGREIAWQVRACNAQNACGGYSAPRTNYLPTAPAERVYPPHRAEASAPRTFIWREVAGADFYRLIVRHGGTVPGVFIDGLPGTSYRLSQADFALLGSPSTGSASWFVTPCWEAGGGADPVCADASFAPFETVGVNFVKFRANPQDPGEVSFDAFIDAFRAGSCTRCHAVANAGFPPGHPGVAGAPTNPGSCSGCHLTDFLPDGTHDIPWKAPPDTMDLRNLGDAQLCARAQDPGTVASDPGDHLSGDPLILWAVSGGQLPLSQGNTEKAWPGTLAEWKQLVNDWNDTGLACEKP